MLVIFLLVQAASFLWSGGGVRLHQLAQITLRQTNEGSVGEYRLEIGNVVLC